MAPPTRTSTGTLGSISRFWHASLFPQGEKRERMEKEGGEGKGSLANQAIFALQRTYAADYIGFAMLVTCYMLVSLPTSQIGRATDTVA